VAKTQAQSFIQAAGEKFGHQHGLRLEIIKRREQAKGFVLLAKRWVVERTFGWLMTCRRLNHDHECNPLHHESLVYLATINLKLRAVIHL
jgi:transposase